LLETSEDLVGREARDPAGIDVFDAALDFGFPVFPEIAKLQTCCELGDQDLTLLLRQLKCGFQNFLRLQHVPSVERPAHDGASFCTGPQLASTFDVSRAQLPCLQHLSNLLESAFGRALMPGAMEDGGLVAAQAEHVNLEENYRGAALLANTDVAPYLSKFPVERPAQGEGIGGDIWSMIERDFPVFFWRARPTNPIVPWYAKQCDGLVRFPEWHVYWRGLPPEKIPPAIEYALALPRAFVS